MGHSGQKKKKRHKRTCKLKISKEQDKEQCTEKCEEMQACRDQSNIWEIMECNKDELVPR